MRTPPITRDEDVEHQEGIQNSWEYPQAQGLYNPNQEHEACGVGFIAAIDGKRCHKILRDAETLSLRMNHRGACACDNDTGQSKQTYPNRSINHPIHHKNSFQFVLIFNIENGIPILSTKRALADINLPKFCQFNYKIS